MTPERLAELRADCERIRANAWYGPPTYNDQVELDCVEEIDGLLEFIGKYARHEPGCDANEILFHRRVVCGCGFDAGYPEARE